MTPRTFIGLAAVTAAVTVAAAFSVMNRYGDTRAGRAEQPLLPNLVATVNDVRELNVVHAGRTITLKRGEPGWVMTEKNGYPADEKKIRDAVVNLSQLRLVEGKTRRADRFPRLEVEDVAAAESKSRLFRLKNAAGDNLAEVIVGKKRYNLGGDVDQGVYVRLPGEEQAWLARGALDIGKDEKDWLDTAVVDIRIKRTRRVSTIAADGAKLVVEKDTPDAENYKAVDPPKDFKPKKNWQWDLNGVGSAMTTLELDDVAPAGEKAFDAENVMKAELQTFGGLIVRVSMLEEGEDTWAVFEAEAGGEATAEPQGEGDERIRDAEAVKKEAAAINARVKGWAYKLPNWKVKPLKLRLTDIEEKAKKDSDS